MGVNEKEHICLGLSLNTSVQSFRLLKSRIFCGITGIIKMTVMTVAEHIFSLLKWINYMTWKHIWSNLHRLIKSAQMHPITKRHYRPWRSWMILRLEELLAVIETSLLVGFVNLVVVVVGLFITCVASHLPWLSRPGVCYPKLLFAKWSVVFYWTLLVATELVTIVAFGKCSPCWYCKASFVLKAAVYSGLMHF